MGLSGRTGTRAGQRGLAIVEFVIGLPILLLLLLVVTEVGRMVSEYNTLTIATRDAARYVSRNAMDPRLGTVNIPASELTTARNLLVYSSPVAGKPILDGLTTGDVDIVVVGEKPDQHVRVTATYAFRPVVVNAIPGFFGEDIPLQVRLTASTVMRAM